MKKNKELGRTALLIAV